MPLEPTKRGRRFQAQKVFTDREPARDAFLKALEAPQDPEEYRVLYFYGVGGEGKSALCREFQRVLQERKAAGKAVGWGVLDFENAGFRDPETGMRALRTQIASRTGFPFPAFDLALARKLGHEFPGADIRQRYPELFQSGSEILEDALELGGTLSEIATLGASKFFVKYGARFGQKVTDWWERRGREDLEEIDRQAESEVVEHMPAYFGWDLQDGMFATAPAGPPSQRLVILLDTYEALWRERGGKNDPGALWVDRWVRRLVRECPGVLFVLLGRDLEDVSRWKEEDSDWEGKIEPHRLGGLSDTDADLFLATVPIVEREVRGRIVGSSQGLPFFLDLQVGTYESLQNAGRQPQVGDFGVGREEILHRFMAHLEGREKGILTLLAPTRWFDEELARHLARTFLGGEGAADFSRVQRHSFVDEIAPGKWTMHALMREYLEARLFREDPGQGVTVREWLVGFYGKWALPGDARSITGRHEDAFAEGAYQLEKIEPSRAIEWIHGGSGIFLQGARYGLLLPLYTRALDLSRSVFGPRSLAAAGSLDHLGDLHKLKGDNDGAEPVYREALSIREEELGPEAAELAGSLDRVASVRIRKSDLSGARPLLERALAINETKFGADGLETAMSRWRLGHDLKDQGFFEEAIVLFRRAREVFEKRSGSSDPLVRQVDDHIGFLEARIERRDRRKERGGTDPWERSGGKELYDRAGNPLDPSLDPRSRGFANVYWDPRYPLRCLVTGEIVEPDADGNYSLWYSSNEDPTPHHILIHKDRLSRFLFYKFQSREICEGWCRWEGGGEPA